MGLNSRKKRRRKSKGSIDEYRSEGYREATCPYRGEAGRAWREGFAEGQSHWAKDDARDEYWRRVEMTPLGFGKGVGQ